jgi:uncharacterized protein (DUF433 family)
MAVKPKIKVPHLTRKDYSKRISIDASVLVGKPIIKGTRISVEFIVDLLGSGWSQEEILENYEQLTRSDVLAALSYAAERLKDERVYPLSVG